jgi:hypothetical protein
MQESRSLEPRVDQTSCEWQKTDARLLLGMVGWGRAVSGAWLGVGVFGCEWLGLREPEEVVMGDIDVRIVILSGLHLAGMMLS